MAKTVVTPRDVDALHETPPAEFVAARGALVKQARAAHQERLAAEIAALRKPSTVVWLVNQLAREHAQDVATLTEAGKRLRQAQGKALRGGGGGELREANAAWRAAVARALKAIRAAAGRAIDEPRIVATLLGAATDPDLAQRLTRGRLTEEAAPPGIEAALGALGPPGKPPPAAAKQRRQQDKEQKRAERRQEREAKTARRVRERAIAAARTLAERADQAAARLEEQAEEVRERARRAREAANEARRRVHELEHKP